MTAPYRPDNPFRDDPPKPKAYRPTNPFAGEVDETDALRGGLEASVRAGQEIGPAKAAEAFALADRTGLPPGTVARNPDVVRALAGQQGFDPARFAVESPTTARWMAAAAEHAAVADGDWEKLGRLERLIGRFELADPATMLRTGRTGGITRKGLLQAEYEKGQVVTELGRLGSLPVAERNTPATRARIAALNAELADELPESRGVVERLTRGSANILPSMVTSVTAGVKGSAIGAGALGAVGFAVGGPLGAAGGAEAGAFIGGLVEAWRTTAELEGGNAILQFERVTDENDQALDPEVADFAGRTVGFLSGALEVLGLTVVLKPFAEWGQAVLARGTAKALQQTTVRSALLNGSKVWASTVAGEVATETAQQGVGLVGEQLARTYGNTQGGAFASIPLERVGSELAATAVETAIGMVLLGVPGGAVTTAQDLARVAEAREGRDRLAALTETAEGSALRQRAPEEFRKLIEADIEAHGAVRDIFVPVERLDALLQEANVPKDEFIRTVLPNPEAYEQATLTGGDVVIPVSHYLSRVVGTDLGKLLGEDIRWRPGQLTAREAKALEKRAEQDYTALREELAEVAATPPEEASAQAVVADITAQLTATGVYTADQVSTMAPAIAAPYVVLAKRAKRDALELYQSRNIRVFGVEEATDIYETVRAVQRAEAKGATPDEVAALRNRLRVLTEQRKTLREAIRAEREAESRVDPAVDPVTGRLARALKTVESDALVVEYIRLRDQQVLDAGAVAGFQETPETQEALGLAEAGAEEDAAGLVPQDTRKAMGRLEREVAARAGTLRRLERELRRREITDADTYASERDLFGDASFDVDALEQRALDDAGQRLADPTAAIAEVSGVLPEDVAVVAARRRAAQEAAARERAMQEMNRLARLDGLLAQESSVRTSAQLARLAPWQMTRDEFYGRTTGAPQFYEHGTGSAQAERIVAEGITTGEASAAYEQIRNASGRIVPAAIAHRFGEKILVFRRTQMERDGISIKPGAKPVAVVDSGSPSYDQIVQQAGGAMLEQAAPARPNAFIIPGVRQQTIGLLATADLSSALHEFAHDYLNLLGELAESEGAEPSLVADWHTVKVTLGITSRLAMTREQQEAWAGQYETYLMTGEAPSRPLLRAFTRFRLWMTDLIRRLNKQFVPLSPELRGVFDRMLATEEAMADLRGEVEHAPVFTSAADAQMTDAEFAAYTQAVETRDALAGAALVRQVLAEREKVRSDEWKAREAEVRDAVTEAVDAEPVYQAVAYLRTGTNPDGTKVAPVVRLSKASLVERYGPGITKTIPTGTFSVDGGVDADTVALAFGFRDGDQLVDALQRFEPRRQAIERRTNEAMRKEFPDLLYDSPALADAAQVAMHRGETDDLLLLELKQMGKVAGIRPPNIVAVRNAARDIIGQTAERDLAPERFRFAEQKAARLAGEAMRSGDAAKAEFHKRQQLLNHVLYREAKKAQEESARIQRFFARMEKASAQERLGKAGAMHRDAMNAILDRYEFRRVPLRQLDRRQSLRDYMQRVADVELVQLTIPPEVLADAAQVNYRTLTMDALRGVHDAGRQVWHVATTKDKLMRAQEKRTLDEQAADVIAGITAHHEMTPRAVDYYPLSLTAVKERLAGVDAWHLAPEFLFRWLDGDQPLGPVWEAFFRPFAEAEADENRLLKGAWASIKELEAMVPEARKRSFWRQRIDVPGFRAKVTGEQIIAIALNWGSESNREALLASTVDGQPLLGGPDAVQAALSLLTADELRYVQAKWDYINTFWPDIKALEEAVHGVAPEKIEAAPFRVRSADGQIVAMQGGYYPLKYDRTRGQGFGKQLVETFSGDLGEIPTSGYARAATRHGWTEARVGSGGRPVDLSLDVFNAHVVNVIHDVTHRRAVRDVARLYERRDIREAIVQSAGQPAYQSIKPWISRVAQPDQTFDNSFVERMFARARAGVVVVNMGLKATTAVTQILGYTQSVDMIGLKWMRKGLTAFLANPAKAWREVQAASSEMEHRRTNYNRDVRDYAAARKGKWARRDEFFFSFIGLMDMVVSVPTWIGAYRQSMESLSPDNHADAVVYADSVVRMTQGAGSPKDLSRIQGGPELRRMLTMHYTFFSRLYGLFRRSGTNLVEGRWGLPRFAASMSVIWFASAILSELIAGRGPEDDEDWREWAVTELLRYPASTVVGVREMARSVGLGSYGYKMTPVEDALAATARTANIGVKAVRAFLDDEEDLDLTEAELKAMVETAGYWGRLPSRQAWITGSYLYDWAMGYEEPETPVEAGRNLLFTRPR